MKTRIRQLLVNQKTSNREISKAYYLCLVLSALILTSLTAIVSPAQNAPNRGLKLGNAYAVGDFENVNLTNGNLMINFPVGSLPAGRGEVGGGISLIYNSKLYDMRQQRVPDPRYFDGFFNKTFVEQNYKGGWRYGNNYSLEYEDRRTGSQATTVAWGANGDKEEPGDYDGDGKADPAVRRGTDWYIKQSSNNQQVIIYNFGYASDYAVQNDYDADGKVDVAVWRGGPTGDPNIGAWYIRQSSKIGQSDMIRQAQWGVAGDIPVPAFFRR